MNESRSISIDAWPSAGPPLIIGIAGGSGSGKTTIARALIGEIEQGRATLIQHDAYYRDLSDLPLESRIKVNFDHPDSLETELLAAHLADLLEGLPIAQPVYDFAQHVRTAETVTVEPRAVVIVEGILVLAERPLRDLMDLKIFVDTDPDLRLMRRLERDVAERGRTVESVFAQYLATVRPMHLRFVEESKRYADMIIPEGFNPNAVGTVLSMIRQVVSEG